MNNDGDLKKVTRRKALQTLGATTAGMVAVTGPAAGVMQDQSDGGPTIEFVTTGEHSGSYGQYTESTDVDNSPNSSFDIIFRVGDLAHGGVVRAQATTAIVRNADKSVTERKTNYIEQTIRPGQAFEFWRDIPTGGWADGEYRVVLSVIDFLNAETDTGTSVFTVD